MKIANMTKNCEKQVVVKLSQISKKIKYSKNN